MKKDLYRRIVEDLRMNTENAWETINAQPSDDMPPVLIPISLKTLNEIIDRAVIRTLDEVAVIVDKMSEIPSLSRASAAKLLKKTPKTLREWEERGTLIPVYIEGSPYYRMSDIQQLSIKKGGRNV